MRKGSLTTLAIALSAAACGFHAGAQSGDAPSIDAPPKLDDAGHEIADWSFASANDFAHGAFSQMGTEPWGGLTPAAYVPGGLVAHGANVALWTAGTDDAHLVWTPTLAQAPDGTGVWRGENIEDATPLPQFGATGTAPFSFWAEGEIYLDGGAHNFSLDADDVGFLEIQAPGGDYQRVVTTRYTTTPVTGTFTVGSGAAGWYPIRLAYEQNGNTDRLRVLHSQGSGTPAPLDRAHLRGRGDGVAAMQRTVFDQQILATSREQIAFDPADFIAANPLQHPGTAGDNSNWSARWTGQFYADTPGNYELTVASDNGNHVFAANANDSSHFARHDETAACVSTVGTAFTAGWNQVLVDYNQSTGGANLSVLVTASPDAALVGHVLPAAKLRPVETSAARLIAMSATGLVNAQIPDNSNTGYVTAFAAAGYAGEVANLVDVTVHANSGHWNQLAIDVVAPNGAVTDVCTEGNCMQNAGYVQQTLAAGAVLGQPASGAWQVRVKDPGHAGGGSVLDVYLTFRTAGGLDTIARHAVWTSDALDLGDRPALDLVSVAWSTAGTAAATAGVAIRLRACATAACDGVAFSDAIAPGTLPTLALPARFLQAQVTIDTDGEAAADLPNLDVMFRRPAP